MKKSSNNFDREIKLYWKYPQKILLISLKELRRRNSYYGLGGEECSSGSRDEEIMKAALIGFAFAKSTNYKEFIKKLEEEKLLEM